MSVRRTILLLLPVAFGGGDLAPDSGVPGSRLDVGHMPSPVLIAPGVVSTDQGEYSPTLDLERGELFFMRRTPGQFDYTIYVSARTESGWTSPEVAPFSGSERDAAPYLDPAGASLLFDSRRPADGLEPGSINLWRVNRTPTGWSEPELLSGPSKGPPSVGGVGADEFGPAVDGKGVVHFYSFRPPYRGGVRLRSDAAGAGTVTVEAAIPDPSAPTFVSYLYLSPDGRTAVMEGRAEGRRDTDLFYSCLGLDGRWSEAEPLQAVNTTAAEGGPWMTPDGATLLFASTRASGSASGGSSDLYELPTTGLPVPCE